MYAECQVARLEWLLVEREAVQEEAMMTIHSQVSGFVPREYEIFVGLDVDKHSIAVTFADHEGLLKSLKLPYSSEHLLHYVRKHFSGAASGVRLRSGANWVRPI